MNYDTTYSAVHKWLSYTHGKADKCEWWNCKGTSQTYSWALLSGKRYEKKRENFWMLCRSCHSLYDGHIQALAEKKHKPVMATWHTRAAICHSRFDSIKIAAYQLGVSKSAISNALHGRAKTAGGYKWTYA